MIQRERYASDAQEAEHVWTYDVYRRGVQARSTGRIVEDLGGYILQKNIMQSEVVLLLLVPIEDMAVVEAKQLSFWENWSMRHLPVLR